MLAAFQTLLYRYTQQEDIVVGPAIANRNRSELEDFANDSDVISQRVNEIEETVSKFFEDNVNEFNTKIQYLINDV